MVYIREAHPLGGKRRPPDRFRIPDPKTLAERQKVAGDFAKEVEATIPILVDTIDDQVEQAYAGWPDRIYVIGQDGRIVFKGDPGPRGFQPSIKEATAVLSKLAAESSTAKP